MGCSTSTSFPSHASTSLSMDCERKSSFSAWFSGGADQVGFLSETKSVRASGINESSSFRRALGGKVRLIQTEQKADLLSC